MLSSVTELAKKAALEILEGDGVPDMLYDDDM